MEDREGSFAIRPGDIILFQPGHSYGSPRPPGPYRAMNILFPPLPGDECRLGLPTKAEYSAPGEDRILIRSRIITENDPALREKFSAVVQLHHSPRPLRRRRAIALLEDLLLELALRSDPQVGRGGQPAEYAIGFLDRNLNRQVGLDELADLTDLSRRTLTRLFRQATGLSIRQYHLAKRLDLAGSILLTHPDITLAEVAETLGFHDAFHLSRAFRQHTGISPDAYRRGKRMSIAPQE